MGNQTGKLQHQAQSGKPKKNVHWKSAERPSPPGRPILIPLSDQQPDVVTLRWERPKLDGGSPIIGYIVEHRRMGSPHWVKATPIPVVRCEVSISGLEPGWRYQFRAIAENIVGKSEPSELSDPLTVTLQRNAISVPRFMNELRDIHAVEDERIEFRVTILGQPPPEINWFKDGYEIFSSRRTKIVNDNDASVLIIHQVALTDEGEIKCTATNRAGHVVTKAKLMVEAPPKIRLPRNYEDGLIVGADEVLRLKVGIAGQPPPTVVWLHEGDEIASGGRFELESTEKNSLLRIDNVKRSDRGEYSIRATNKLGEHMSSFLVTVTSRPNPPGKVRLNMSFGKSATLSWIAPDDDGGCKIGNYVIEYFRVGWNVWLKAATTRLLSTTLNDLIEGSEYKFRVKAENPYGLSDPGEESDILFIPDPKRGINKPERSAQSEMATVTVSEKNKPVPPRRKALSPQRAIEEEQQIGRHSAASSPRQHSPNILRKHRPQVLDSEDLHREMSYGTPINVLNLQQRRSSPSFIGIDMQLPAPTPPAAPLLTNRRSPSPRLEPVKAISKVDSYIGDQRSPPISPNHETTDRREFFKLSSPHTIASLTKPPISRPRMATPERSQTPDIAAIRNRSLSPVKTVSQSLGNESSPPPVAPKKTSTALQRSEEPVNEYVNQNIGHYSEQLTKAEVGQDAFNEVDKITAATPNPTIHISGPPSDSAPLSETEKRDEVHTSNEFMLVLFHKNSKVKDTEKQDSFDLDLEEALQPPPISISSPDLASLEYNNLQTFPLRRSVSSTELLYERAMARFYEAVEMEEAEKFRKTKKQSEDKLSVQPTTTIRKRLGSMTETERLSFEKRSEMRRRSADRVKDSPLTTPLKWDSRDNLYSIKPISRPREIMNQKYRQDSQETDELIDYEAEHHHHHQHRKDDSYEIGSDYTESTASSDEDSIEKFKIELMARTKSISEELETYHPRNMSAGVFTPYRSPTPEQSAIVLNRPLPLPSPDFVPKPILKKSSNENVFKEDNNNSVVSMNTTTTISNNPPPPASEKLDLAKGIKSLFKRGDKKSTTEKNTEENEISLKVEEMPKPRASPVPTAADVEAKRRSKEEEERKRIEAERIYREEAKVAAAHYSDIVREVGSTRKYTVPLYLNRDELKKAAEKAAQEGLIDDEEDENLTIASIIRSHSPQPQAEPILPAIIKTKSSLSERQQEKHVKTTASNLAFIETKPIPKRQPDTPSEEDTGLREQFPKASSTPTGESLESRGRTKVVKVKKIIKKRVPSSTRSRDQSSSRPPSSMASTNDIPDSSTSEPPQSAVKRRIASRTRTSNGQSKSPGPLGRKPLSIALPPSPSVVHATKTPDQLAEEAHEKVRSAFSYSTDLVLFIVACYVYLFKDARLVLPILALMIYRQMGEAISNIIPSWIKRKKN